LCFTLCFTNDKNERRNDEEKIRKTKELEKIRWIKQMRFNRFKNDCENNINNQCYMIGL
jgi:hypothetical protein